MVGHFATDFHRVPMHRACSLPSLFFTPLPPGSRQLLAEKLQDDPKAVRARNSQFGEINWNANATDAYG